MAVLDVRLEWGPVGARTLAVPDGIAVVVDVLSFTTTLAVAAGRGIEVVPHPRDDDHAHAHARQHAAVLAVRRAEARSGDVSLSPASFLAAGPVERVVLPSPNGSTISSLLGDQGIQVVGASLRNRCAVAHWVRRAAASNSSVAVIPAGERWPDGSLRPAVEDLWGAGAVVRALAEGGPAVLSPEAAAAAAAFDAVVDDLPAALAACTSGVELHERGYPGDVAVAARLDADAVVPVLRDGVFSPEPG